MDHSDISSAFKRGGCKRLLMVQGESGSTKLIFFTVDGRSGGKVESKSVKVLLLKVEGKLGFKKTNC